MRPEHPHCGHRTIPHSPFPLTGYYNLNTYELSHGRFSTRRRGSRRSRRCIPSHERTAPRHSPQIHVGNVLACSTEQLPIRSVLSTLSQPILSSLQDRMVRSYASISGILNVCLIGWTCIKKRICSSIGALLSAFTYEAKFTIREYASSLSRDRSISSTRRRRSKTEAPAVSSAAALKVKDGTAASSNP